MDRLVMSLTLIISLFYSSVALGSKGQVSKVKILQLKHNESVYIDDHDVTLSLLELVDSRCPEDVVCFWEGNIMAQIAIYQAERYVGTFEITNLLAKPQQSAYFLGRYKLELHDAAQDAFGKEALTAVLALHTTEDLQTIGCRSVLQGACSFEYQPVVCSFGYARFIGENPCKAFKHIRYYACQSGAEILEADINCENVEVDSPHLVY